MTDAPLRLVIADDHVVVRAGLRALLEGEPGLEVIAEASHPEEAVQLALSLRPDVVLMDLRFDGRGRGDGSADGIEAVRAIAAGAPELPVVMLTSYSGRGEVVRALEAGARGYVLKAGPPEDLFRAVRSAAVGGMGLAPEIVGDLVGQVVSPAPELTRREREVVQLMSDGHSNRAIAESLYLSEATIKTHLVRIYRKLGVDNRAAAVSEAVRRGLLDLS
ncbi:response regulator transcription factor [Streptomyces sp. SID13726]|uniref:response regulator n=1 Tax=Streptomyces sp. SID13726 TaxID=2706058 RepID=UPI0013B73CCE|nr:response regulator transcription factor [Streptomyces sp. SID13726]NEA98781.1 response regulator transcription factor [Streptomyces sp. SID13726]